MQIANHLIQLRPSYIRTILNASKRPGVISLAGGLPASNSFPMPLLSDGLASVSRQPDLFQYGETQGYPPLLTLLEQLYPLPPTHSTLISNGAQQAIDLIARTFINPGDHIVVEAPGYSGALKVFELSRASIQSVTQTRLGPDLNHLETLFTTKRITAFYTVPDFHNPTGLCWSLPTRQAVARLCRQHSVLLIEDAPYRPLRFTGDNLPMVSTFCPEQALVIRSFSKIIAPGLRLAMLTAPRLWMTALSTVKQAADLHTNLPLQQVLLKVMQHDGLEDHKHLLCQQYHQRYLALTTALTNEGRDLGQFAPVEGGMFIWLVLPAGDSWAIAAKALEEGVAVVPGDAFYSHHATVQTALRLNFSYTEPEKFAEAITRLRRAIRAVTAKL